MRLTEHETDSNRHSASCLTSDSLGNSSSLVLLAHTEAIVQTRHEIVAVGAPIAVQLDRDRRLRTATSTIARAIVLIH